MGAFIFVNFVISFAIGLYVGFWCMFVRGIVQLVNGVKSTPANSKDIGIGISKMFFSGITGIFVFIVSISILNNITVNLLP